MSAPLKLSRSTIKPYTPQGRGSYHPVSGTPFFRKDRVLAPIKTRATATDPAPQEEDLWQIKDRENWYLSTWAADDQPDWNRARILQSHQLAPGVKEVVIETEISRELVPLRNAYKHIGQLATVRINSGPEIVLSPTCAPFPQELNKEPLFVIKGDLFAHQVKLPTDPTSVLAELSVLVREDDAPELYKATGDEAVEVGPFVKSGLSLKGPMLSPFLYPTVIVFVEGLGIAAAKALVSATPDSVDMSAGMREDFTMYYRAPNEASLCFKEELEEWKEKYHVKVVTSTRDSFSDMFDDDDTLVYEPQGTVAIILTGGDPETEKEALEVCKSAEIRTIVRQSQEQKPTRYINYGTEASSPAEQDVGLEEEEEE